MRQNLGTALTVTATEKWLAAVQAGQAFSGIANQAAVAAQFPHCQLFNPVGSGKTALVRAVLFQFTTASFFNVALDNVQRATDVAAGVNLLNGGAAGVCHTRAESNAVAQGTPFAQFATLANVTVLPPIEWWMQLAPGQGLDCVGTQVNTQLFGTFMWIET